MFDYQELENEYIARQMKDRKRHMRELAKVEDMEDLWDHVDDLVHIHGGECVAVIGGWTHTPHFAIHGISNCRDMLPILEELDDCEVRIESTSDDVDNNRRSYYCWTVDTEGWKDMMFVLDVYFTGNCRRVEVGLREPVVQSYEDRAEYALVCNS